MRTSTGPSAMPWANLAFSRLRMSVAAGLSVCSLRTIAAGSPWPLPALPGAAPPKSQIFWLWGRKRQCLAVGLAQGCKQIKAPDDPTCETVVLKCRLVWRDVWRDAWWWVYEMRCVRWDVGLKFVLRLPHESSAKSTPLATRKQTGPSGVQARRQSPESQCCACHAKATPGAAKCESSAKSIKCWPCHAKATGLQRRPSARRQSPESQSIAPATQKQHQVQLCEMNCVRWVVWDELCEMRCVSWKRHITRKATYHTVWSVDSVFLCGRLPGCLVVSPRPHHVWPSVPIPQYSLATRGLWFCPTSRRTQAPRTALQCFANQVWPPISSWSSLWYSTLYSTVEPADCNNLQACRMIFTAGKNRSALEESQWWTGVAGNQNKSGRK